MEFAVAILLPTTFLMMYMSVQMWTIFEPHFAINTAEGRELLAYFSSDQKLVRMAEWYASLLTTPTEGINGDATTAGGKLRAAMLFELARHRFLCGDDPGKLILGPTSSRLFQRAQARAEWNNPVPIALLIIRARVVKAQGEGAGVVWSNKPQPYRSRFRDKYDGDGWLFEEPSSTDDDKLIY